MPRRPQDKSDLPYYERIPRDLAGIMAPTLLLWSADDHEVPVTSVARDALSRLAATDKVLMVIDHCGHLMPMECGPQSAALARVFFDRIAATMPLATL